MSSEEESINYDSDPVIEVELEGVDYRLDAGKQGTALCISSRPAGTWDWQFLAEAKWDNLNLRCKELPRPTREELGRALKSLAE